MTIKEKIQLHRSAYINKYGVEPKSLIIGYEVYHEAKKEMPSRLILPGASMYGMIIIMDKNNPTRVEAGDFET